MSDIDVFGAVEKLIEKLADVGLWGSFREGCGIVLGWAILFSSALVSRETTAMLLTLFGSGILGVSGIALIIRIAISTWEQRER